MKTCIRCQCPNDNRTFKTCDACRARMKEERLKRKQMQEEANDEPSNKRRRQSETLSENKAAMLPKEVLSIIFKFVDSAAQIGECRAVCKSWDDPAAISMFSRKVTVRSELKALQLYRYLFKDSSKISFIRHMEFKTRRVVMPLVYGELLRMVHSPKIERYTGNVKANNFFDTLLNIDNQLGSESGQLQDLPTYSGEDTLTRRKRFFLKRNNTNSLTVNATLPRNDDNWYLFDKLDQFKSLTGLKLRGSTNGLPDLEDILKKCPHLTSLEIKEFELCDPTASNMSKEDVIAWTAANAKVESGPLTIGINSTFRPELLEYLVYRYLDIQKLEIKGFLWTSSQSQSDILSNGDLERVLNAISNINEKDITIFLPMSTKMVDCVRFAKSRPFISFDIEEKDGKEQLILRIR